MCTLYFLSSRELQRLNHSLTGLVCVWSHCVTLRPLGRMPSVKEMYCLNKVLIWVNKGLSINNNNKKSLYCDFCLLLNTRLVDKIVFITEMEGSTFLLPGVSWISWWGQSALTTVLSSANLNEIKAAVGNFGRNRKTTKTHTFKRQNWAGAESMAVNGKKDKKDSHFAGLR